MAEAVLTSKGQITIPKEIRELFGLSDGDRVDFISEKGWIIMVPLKGNILDLYGSVPHRGKAIDFSKLRERVKKEMAKKFRK
ncbi:MAG: AbrB/MazE/SpoVT family DNA-binding domain-containing protein [Candidatus Margulisbacteria bacterium]|nr:AbrB/MazE/SpoVT family DNA-binding domain-containing protein [Candidatus Margulisiibacteriota bacterium]